MSKLYRVRVSFTYYAYVDSGEAAEECAQQAFGDTIDPMCDVDEVAPGDKPEDGWNFDCLAYNDDVEDTPLSDVWPQAAPAPGTKGQT